MARGRGIPIAEILQYDLFPKNVLFDKDYTFKPDKATLVKKLDERLVHETHIIFLMATSE